MSQLVLFNKPYGVLSQFTDDSGRMTLKPFFNDARIYPAGRLDFDSEGLLLLTDDGKLQQKISDPRFKMPKTYWVQVDGAITDEALQQLCKGVLLKDGMTRPATALQMDEPAQLWPRDPPVRYRASIPTSWIALTIKEGRNRQVRRMTAAVGFPTLRLIRASIGPWALDALQPGQSVVTTV
ncbi:MAG TPA: rRNA large subunit pseudouridine synthase E [Pseudomonadales bacterium]|nr:rRNA large subunit pseudouridine synthase E [Pseudomonadales bacterium]